MASDFIEKLMAGRWIAGARIEDAIAVASKLNTKGISAILNYLGEEFIADSDVNDAVATYGALLRAIKDSGINASISLKPTQLGLRISGRLAEQNYKAIIGEAERRKVFVWLDMESSKDVPFTINIYKKYLHDENSGICIQAYLRRSAADVKCIAAAHGIIRLVKGAYTESTRVAYKQKHRIDANYMSLLRYLFKHSGRLMVATHDTGIISNAIALNRVYHRHVEYAMLNGIRNRYAAELAKKESVAIYVPFGSRWVDYAYRRLREAGHLNIIVRSLLESQKI